MRRRSFFAAAAGAALAPVLGLPTRAGAAFSSDVAAAAGVLSQQPITARSILAQTVTPEMLEIRQLNVLSADLSTIRVGRDGRLIEELVTE